MTDLDMLMSELVQHSARAGAKRAPRGKRGHGSDAADRARVAMADARRADERAALDRRDKEEERLYRRRVGRLRSLQARRAAVRLALAEWQRMEPAHMVTARSARLVALLGTLSAHTERVFSLPILPADILPGGRFHKRALWRGMDIGMLAVSAEDVVMGAVELCYLKGQTAEDERGRVVPTIGAMYRNMAHFWHAQVDRFRQAKRGLIAVHSVEALIEGLGWDRLDAMSQDARRLDNLGYSYADMTEYPVVTVPADMAEVSRDALKRAEMHRRALERLAGIERKDRDRAATAVPVPTGLSAEDRAAWQADRVAIRVLINGGTLADVAAAVGVSERVLSERLLRMEGALGATVHSGRPDGEPVRSTLDHASEAVKYRHQSKGWTSTGEQGCRASEVVVTTI